MFAGRGKIPGAAAFALSIICEKNPVGWGISCYVEGI
jgi:hypothetical protein